MKKFFQFLLGLNGASVVRGLRFGFPEFIRSCFASLEIVHPLEKKEHKQLQKELKDIPESTVGEILGTKEAPIKLSVKRHDEGMLSFHEAIALLSVLVVENPLEVLEIGTFMGHTAKAMAENLTESIVHTVDLPTNFSMQQDLKTGPLKDDLHLISRRVVGREFKGQTVEQRIRQHFGDSAVIDFQEFGKPTFFFIDGAHTYEYCKQDSEKCFRLCGGTGTFFWHDCDIGHPGVVKFITEWRSLGRNIVRIKGTALAYWKNG